MLFTAAVCASDGESLCNDVGSCDEDSVSPGTFACVCDIGYTGNECETNINDCDPDPCQNGNCNDGINAYSCTCDVGYFGAICDGK